MSITSYLLAPLALMAPLLPGGEAQFAPSAQPQVEDIGAMPEPGWVAMEAMRNSSIAYQMRIEQRVTIRITPRPPQMRQNLIAELPPREIASHFEERKMGKCVPVSSIVGVQPGEGSQLILFMRDRRIISANLEKSCRGRDFYSGFYLERSKDGLLCVGRDKLHARTGANCEVSRMRQLVEVQD